jgi:peptidoglycan hydrolase-like protein with peptidoglycan-binding domain
MAILKKGLAGEPVRRLQAKLGVKVDGDFGPGTEKALKDWQKANGLAADGIAGPDTFMAMGLYELVLLKQGTRGATVKALQERLGIAADGSFGPGTEKAVRAYQTSNGLGADGLAGPVTLAHMKLFQEFTPEVARRSQVPAASVEVPVSGNLSMPSAAPEIGAPPVVAADATGATRSIWDSIKSIFK